MPLSEYEQRILTELESAFGASILARHRLRLRVLTMMTGAILLAAASAMASLTIAHVVPVAAGVPATLAVGLGLGVTATLAWSQRRPTGGAGRHGSSGSRPVAGDGGDQR